MLPSVSVARTVKSDAPLPVGVPVMAPLLALSDSPAGSAPDETAKVYGPVPPLAVTVWL